MTPEKQRIAIAEACGWKPQGSRTDYMGGEVVHKETMYLSPNGYTYATPSNGFGFPDWLNDLNATHEAEKVLTDSQRRAYVDALGCVVNGLCGCDSDDEFYFVCATAAQRAEAFIKAIGKWEDDK